MAWTKEQMAERAAAEIQPDMVVNLGIGMPTLVPEYVSAEAGVMIHSENGLLGMGPFPTESEVDPQLINAGKQTVTAVPGASTFDSSLSFAMIRGGHIDLAILGAMQVSAAGDLANWAIPGGRMMGMGGAMDLANGARRIVVMTQHVTKRGEAKLVASCSFPLTAAACTSRVITDLCVLDPKGDHFALVELAPGVSAEEVRGKTDAPVKG